MSFIVFHVDIGSHLPTHSLSHSPAYRLTHFSTRLRHFCLLQCNRAADKKPGNQPHDREETNTEDQPRQCEAEHPRSHQVWQKIICERQSEDTDQKCGGAENREPKLPAHEHFKK